MRKLKLLLMALALFGGVSLGWAQTDVTATYLTNADFETGEALTDTYLYGYGKDGTPYGFQTITGWTSVVTSGDNSNSSYPNSGMAGGVFGYGSSTQLKGNATAAPATNPAGEATGNCFGFFGVWGCGGYYYQNVTLAAGKYTITVPMYNQSGTQANTTYTGFFPTSGTNRTVAVNPTVGEWVNQTVTFTLTEDTEGQVRIGYQSTGNGSGSNPHIFIDCVKIEFTAIVVKDVLETAITSATSVNSRIKNSDLTTAIATAQAVYNDEDATQEGVNNAAATLNTAVETAMAAYINNGGDPTLALANADLSSLDGWTVASTSSYNDKGNGLIGTYNVRFSAATVDDTHLDKEYCFGFEARWSGNYASYNQTTVALPAGVYTLTYDVENVNGSTSNLTYADYNFVEVGGIKNYSSTTEWMAAKSGWTTHTIRVTLNEPAPITVSFGYGTGDNNPSADITPALYVSHVQLSRSSFLEGAKAAWDEAKAAAEAAITNEDYTIVTGSEKTALQTEIDKTEPTTVDGYNAATEALKTATLAFTNAKASYDAFVAAKAVEYKKDTEKYPYASDTKFDAIATAQSAEPTSAADADAKTAAIISAYRKYVESNALAEGVSGAVNMTNLIGDPNFEGVTIDGTTAGAWTFDQTGGTVGIKDNESFTDGDGNSNYSYFDYNNDSENNQNVHQVIKNVAPGRYLLSATGRGHTNFNGILQLYVVGKENINIPTNGNKDGVFSRGWSDVSVEFELEATSDITIGAKTNNNKSGWWSVTRFRLVQLEATPLAEEDDYAELNSAIEQAENKVLGFAKDEYAPYKNVAALEALAAAKSVDQEAELTKEYVNNVTSALTSAEWTVNNSEVDAIFDGQFAQTAANSTSGDITLPGWTKVDGIRLLVKDAETDPGLSYTNGGAAVFSWGGTTLTYGNQKGYTLPMAKHTIYELTLKVAGWRDGDLPTYFSVELDGDKRIVSPVVGRINSSEGNPFAEYRFYLQPTEDSSVLKIYGNKHFAIADLSLVKATTPIELSVTAAGYATYVTEAPLNFSETAIKAYTAKVSAGKVVLTKIDKVPANTPVVLYCEGGTENEVIPFATDTDEVPASDLVAGTSASVATIDGDYTNYILNNVDGIGFYKAADQKVAANRAYLHVPTSEIPTTSRLTIVFEDATGIASLTNSKVVNSEEVYNLNGQRVGNAKKGLYIIGGKKKVIK